MFAAASIVNLMAVNALAVILGLSAIALLALIFIVWAPWTGVRRDGRLDRETESRLLLGENPEIISADLEKREQDDKTPKNFS